MHGWQRTMSRLLASGLVLALVAGCGSSAKKSTTADPKAGTKQVELNLVAFPGISIEAITDINDEFSKRHPNVRVRIKDTQSRQLVGADGVNAPGMDGIDIVLAPQNFLNQLAANNLVKDLSALKLPKLNDGVARFYDDLGLVNGKRYGLALSVTPSMLLVNEAQLAKAGLKPPALDWTWQEFEQIAATTQAAGMINQIQINSVLELAVRSYGGMLYDPDRQAWAFDTPEAKQGIAVLGAMVTKGLVSVQGGGGQFNLGNNFRVVGPGGAGGTDARGGRNNNQNAAALIAVGGGGSGGAFFIQNASFAQYPYPRGPKGQFSAVTATVAAVVASSTNPEMATEYVKDLLAPAAQTFMAKTGSRPVAADAKALAAWQEKVTEPRARAIDAALQGGFVNTTPNLNTMLTGMDPYFTGKAALDPTVSSLITTLK